MTNLISFVLLVYFIASVSLKEDDTPCQQLLNTENVLSEVVFLNNETFVRFYCANETYVVSGGANLVACSNPWQEDSNSSPLSRICVDKDSMYMIIVPAIMFCLITVLGGFSFCTNRKDENIPNLPI